MSNPSVDQTASAKAPTAGLLASAFSPAYRQYALWLFLVCHACAGIDLRGFAILLQPIKVELHLTDTQLGLISGAAFGILFGVAGIPVGWLADRTNRRNLVVAMLGISSVMTAVCGAVVSFPQIAIARMGVGLGQGGVSPPTHSIISDMFPIRQRGTAMSYYSAGMNVGGGVGLFIAGWVSQYYGWRAAVYVISVPGLVISLIVLFTLREPARGSADGVRQTGHAPSSSLIDTLKFFASQPSFRHVLVGGGLISLVGNGFAAWLPAYLIRSYGVSLGSVGTALAFIAFFFGGTGTFLAGPIMDRFGSGDLRRGLWGLGLIYLAIIPAEALVVLAHGPTAAICFFVIPLFFQSFFLGPCSSFVQSLAPLRMRAMAAGCMFLVFSLLGTSAGTVIVGMLSDYLAPRFGAESVRYGLLIVIAINVWGATHFYLAARTIRADVARAHAIDSQRIPGAADGI